MERSKQELVLRILGNGKYAVDFVRGVLMSYKKGRGVWEDLKPNVLPSGYKQHVIHLGRGKGVKCVVYLHILVYLYQNGIYDEDLVIGFKDMDKGNCAFDNLEAMSIGDDLSNGVDYSRSPSGYVSLIRYEEIVKIKALLCEHPNWSKAKVARELGLNRIPVSRVINKIKRGEVLKYEVPGPYKSPNAKVRVENGALIEKSDYYPYLE